MLVNRAKKIIIALFLMWFLGLILFCIKIFIPKSHSENQADAIIVLTGGSLRIEEGLLALNSNKSQKLFISGVHEDVRLADISDSLNKNQVFLGKSATNTHENAEETKIWIEKNNINSIILITSHYHMPRSILEFKILMPKLKIFPHEVRPTMFDLGDDSRIFTNLFLILKEYNKYLAVLVMYYANN